VKRSAQAAQHEQKQAKQHRMARGQHHGSCLLGLWPVRARRRAFRLNFGGTDGLFILNREVRFAFAPITIAVKRLLWRTDTL
jgi:hypothetical protein